MTHSEQLTETQNALHSKFFSAIGNNQSVTDILKATKEYTATDIEAVLTKFHGVGVCSTLLAYAIENSNTQALQDLLDIAKKAGLEGKILTNIQYKVKEGVQNTLLEHARDYKSNMVEIIEERMEANGIPIPPKPQSQAAGPGPVIDSPESPSFLSQHKGKFAIIGAIALVGTIAAFMSGYPIIGIIVALTATFMLATDKGRELCDGVGKKLDDALPECFKSKEAAKG